MKVSRYHILGIVEKNHRTSLLIILIIKVTKNIYGHITAYSARLSYYIGISGTAAQTGIAARDI